jgi:hypothetical protein
MTASLSWASTFIENQMASSIIKLRRVDPHQFLFECEVAPPSGEQVVFAVYFSTWVQIHLQSGKSPW